MSQTVIDHSPDLKRLQNEGYSLFAQDGYLVIDDIPYLNSGKEVVTGRLITAYTQAGSKAVCSDHIVFFDGETPHDIEGRALNQIINGVSENVHSNSIKSRMRFSSKPDTGYKDIHHKMTSYIEMLAGPARVLDPSSTPRKYKAIPQNTDNSPFVYSDTNASRAGVQSISQKLSGQRIGIIGLGGTGSYILDFVAKTPVTEIRLIDGDEYYAHNAFRSPSAASIDELNAGMKKVVYHQQKYSKLHRGITIHPCYLSKETMDLLDGLDFVFIAIDQGSVKADIFAYLDLKGIPHIDVGMGVEITPSNTLRGAIRTTAFTNPSRLGLRRFINLKDDDDAIYSSNIQICELNAFNAVLAVVAWKRHMNFYHESVLVGQTSFNIDTMGLIGVDHES
ncbi:ThiF family adenylyltransferase [Sulfuricurvum sp.]|uniref:ThiF family adenylyltransferase n=1 Tax=Sulfuricurvum sp. TaxID=2025608 RepID=UPI002614214D|nr:ThiF family adenylyltransferase [Sulfuricurvum sp.]MDD2267710.1 ThiF family adenylyltransferase [Sulfuricurvum sp.]MDD2783307.1 ThiF family adenylyltransferase [Sulfuricurvum sp.]